ncbi:solute symporter family [Acididesulfobacillus acetoxydans]|uniref:Na+/solute symporter n=1 Tax=Acididesulfobacillus acetoxydans TaxID=1561005 RepID=A0A8S0XD37_9FIRM|nr:sodium:solute symporter family protein [Acididesulfobacillus acetoxydans]CAA7603086.1 solute symporter family [Acididesulfobacillus acetoxydans]CEJ05676.1 Na+/solute symporter [Acididesulfobacillus acetoxydans]
MSDDLILGTSFIIVFAVTLFGAGVGKKKSTDMEGWLVNNRKMGTFLVWFLLGSEIYTIFTFEGLAGYAYINGAAAFYNVALNDVAYAIGFMVLPTIWLIGKRFRYVTQSDFIEGRYQSKNLGIFVALASALIMIAYIDLNITGLSAVIQVIGQGSISPTWADTIGFLVLAGAVFFGGIRGNAWQAVIKDVLMLVAVVILFVVIPIRYFGSFGYMYGSFVRKIPSHLVLPGVSKKLGPVWLITTVILNAVGQWMWPQWFGVAYTAKSPRTLKLQAVFMPFYQLVKVAVITIGFAAVLILGTSKPGNNVIMMLALKTFPQWFLILFTVAAILAAIVPAGPIVMTSSSLMAKNVVQGLNPRISDTTVYKMTKALVFPITIIALFLTIVVPSLIVSILLVAYDFISQLFPAIVLGGLFWRRATKEGVLAGMLSGWAVAAYLVLTKHDPIGGWNAGMVALLVNIVVFWLVSLATKPVPKEILTNFYQDAFPQTPADPSPNTVEVIVD